MWQVGVLVVTYEDKDPGHYPLYEGVNVVGRQSSSDSRDAERRAAWQARHPHRPTYGENRLAVVLHGSRLHLHKATKTLAQPALRPGLLLDSNRISAEHASIGKPLCVLSAAPLVKAKLWSTAQPCVPCSR